MTMYAVFQTSTVSPGLMYDGGGGGLGEGGGGDGGAGVPPPTAGFVVWVNNADGT